MCALAVLLVTVSLINLYIDSTEEILDDDTDDDITTTSIETKQEYRASTDLEVWNYRGR